jgi:hypothetical protein
MNATAMSITAAFSSIELMHASAALAPHKFKQLPCDEISGVMW